MVMSAAMCLCIMVVAGLLYIVRHAMTPSLAKTVRNAVHRILCVACADRKDAAMLPAWNACKMY